MAEEEPLIHRVRGTERAPYPTTTFSRTGTSAALPTLLLGGLLTAGCDPSAPPPQCGEAQKENTPVALQAVQECGTLAEQSGLRGQEQAQLTAFQPAAVTRVTAGAKGSFSTTVTIPEIVLPKAPNHYVIASGNTSSRTDKQAINVLP